MDIEAEMAVFTDSSESTCYHFVVYVAIFHAAFEHYLFKETRGLGAVEGCAADAEFGVVATAKREATRTPLLLRLTGVVGGFFVLK